MPSDRQAERTFRQGRASSLRLALSDNGEETVSVGPDREAELNRQLAELTGRLDDLQARVAQSEQDNAQLRRVLARAGGLLTDPDLLVGLPEASALRS